jgi:hypothetical protein
MMTILVASVLFVLSMIPVAAAFAEGNGGDRPPYVLQETGQDGSINTGTVAGSDEMPSRPYNQLRIENMGQ